MDTPVAGTAFAPGIPAPRVSSQPRTARHRDDSGGNASPLFGIFVAVSGPAYLLGAGIALIVSPAVWPVAVLGSGSLGTGLDWPGYRMWQPMIAAT